MHDHKMYKELVLYIEACYSGSMFLDLLPSDWNIYVMTAASPTEPSRATYCHPYDYIGDVHMKTCLGDVFSVTWMEQVDGSNTKTLTLDQQFEKVKSDALKARSSHVQRYGDMKIADFPIGNFIGVLNEAPLP